MPSVRDVLGEHDRWIDSLVKEFEGGLRGIVASAQARTLGELQKRLTITNGVIDRTPANLRTLRQIGKIFDQSMRRAGYESLAEEFVLSFNGHLPYFDRVLETISENLKQPLRVELNAQSVAYLESQQISVVGALDSIVDAAAAAIQRKALMSVGALSFGDLVEQISTVYGRSITEAATLAETSQVMFYRSISERGFAQIEQDLPEGSVRYRFEGPVDRLTRPFCKRVVRMTRKHALTRAQIGRLDNGQIPDVMTSGGGYNCRHQWVIEELRT